ncbi:MAG: S41 family peptidase [Puia sp.]
MDHRPRGQERKRKKPTFYLSSVNLQLDTVMKTGFMTVTTFDRSNHLRKFFKNSFRQLQENHIKNLIIDVRSNGGGDAGLSTLLTRYIADHKFKLADSLYTIKPPAEYRKYIQNGFWYGLLVSACDQKGQGWQVTLQIFEKTLLFRQKKNIIMTAGFYLIGGNSFSATTLFAGDLKGQKNVILVGEETGGGYYGNTA